MGDNVGDVAGMGADLYESYCGSILATSALGAAAFMAGGDVDMQFKAVIAPMLIAAVGILLSILGIFSVRTKEDAGMKDLLNSLSVGTNLSSALIVVATFLILWVLQIDNWLNISFAVVIGLLVGIVIGRSTEYYTSQSYRPTQLLAESGKTGPATVIISGIGLGMVSTTIPVIAVVIGIILSYWLAAGFDFANVSMGLYGIGIAAVGMLSTLGITLATDAYGPIADNAGGNAEMSGLGEAVRKRTDALDSLGNTTAATGKGFAIGSAALTGLALLASYIEEIRIGLTRLGETVLTLPNGDTLAIHDASFTDFMTYYDVTLMNPKVLSGMFIGSMMAFLFCGLTMNAVGRAAAHMVEEVRRQLKDCGYQCSLINARFAKPLDGEMLKTVASEHKLLVTLEENVENGGFGEHVLRYLTENHLQTEFLACAIPDEYVEHGNVELLKQEVGIDARTITEKVITTYVSSCLTEE